MSHVTTLAQLEAEMLRLVSRRDTIVNQANETIAAANREFDEAAVPLGRKINQLRAQQRADAPPPTKPKRRREPLERDEGFTDEEWQHYQELRTKQGG